MLILNIITSINLLFVFSVLFFRKENAFPNKVLALILINPGINFISNVNILAGNLEGLPYLYFFAQTTALLFAPLVLIYTNLMIGRRFGRKNPLFYLTGAAVLMMIYYTVEFSLLSKEVQQQYLRGIFNGPYPDQMIVSNAVFVFLQQAYFTVAAFQLYKYRKNLSNLISNFEKTRYDYVSKFVLLIWILNLITLVLYGTLPMVWVEYICLPVVLTVIYSFIFYFSFHHNSIFTRSSFEHFQSENEPLVAALDEKVSAEPEIANAELNQIALQLEVFLSERETFINPDLTIYMFADEFGMNHRKISAVLNKVIGKTFYDYINEKRVEKAKNLLFERSGITIEGVGYESGFNSRASFYRAFKKHTGQTPSQYLEEGKAQTV